VQAWDSTVFFTVAEGRSRELRGYAGAR